MNRIRDRWRAPLGVLAVLAFGVAVVHAVPRATAQESQDIITLQARITQSGTPLDADLDLTFELFSASSGGSALWTEAQSAVPVRSGILSVRLGTVTSLGTVFRP